MKINNIVLSKDNLTKGGGMILTGVRPAYEYNGNTRSDKVIGLKVSVVLEKNAYDTLAVTVADPVDKLSAVLEKANGAPVYVDFVGLTARVYSMNGRTDVSAKAESVYVVNNNVVIDLN